MYDLEKWCLLETVGADGMPVVPNTTPGSRLARLLGFGRFDSTIDGIFSVELFFFFAMYFNYV